MCRIPKVKLKVYVVIASEWGNDINETTLVGVFSSIEKAREAVKKRSRITRW